MHDFPQPPLGEAGDIPIDRHDPFEMDGLRLLVILAEHLELRMIDDQPAVGILHFAVNDHLLSGRDEFVDERHVEPAAGDFPGPEDAARAVHDDRLVKPAARARNGAWPYRSPCRADTPRRPRLDWESDRSGAGPHSAWEDGLTPAPAVRYPAAASAATSLAGRRGNDAKSVRAEITAEIVRCEPSMRAAVRRVFADRQKRRFRTNGRPPRKAGSRIHPPVRISAARMPAARARPWDGRPGPGIRFALAGRTRTGAPEHGQRQIGFESIGKRQARVRFR